MDYSELSLVNIGDLIEKRLEEVKMSHAELARAINMDQSNMNRQLRKESMDTGRLTQFSKALRYNFFMEYSKDDQYRHLKNDDFKIDETIHIGGIIKAITQRYKVTYEELCSRLTKLDPQSVYRRSDISKLVSRKTIDTAKLLKISAVLDINFFEFYCMDVNERLLWAHKNMSNLPEYDVEDDSSTFGREMTRKSKETADIIEELSKVKADYAVLEYKYKVLQKRLKEAGLPYEVEQAY